ncbi:MAG: hypothetical protein IK066_01555 [Kiritimatiellae bacterium]|nr:hypothetical protein [Kiritimatiellia bacterium]
MRFHVSPAFSRFSPFFVIPFALLAWLPLLHVSPNPFPFPTDAPLLLARPPLGALFATPWPALAFHLLAAALFGCAIQTRHRSPALALAASALYAFHPAASEILAAPAHRPLALAFALFALAAAAFPRAPRRPRAVVLPAAAFLLGLFLLGPALLDGWRATAPLYAADPAWTLPQRLASAPWLFFRSLRYLLVPWPLNVAQPADPVAPFTTRFWVGLLWLALAVAGAIRFRRTFPALSDALVLLLVGFVPFSGLYPLPHPIADRYLCFMLPGYALAVAAVLLKHPSRGARAAATLLLLLLFALLLRIRLPQWRSAETLLAAAAFQNPASVSLNLACADLCDALDRPDSAAAFRAEAARMRQ